MRLHRITLPLVLAVAFVSLLVATTAIGWNLSEIAALFSLSRFYVGNDTGVMNMAAAVGIRTYALFGTTPPFHHSRQIVPIISDPGGPDDGMARVTVPMVLEAIIRDRSSIAPAQTPRGK